MAITVVLGVVAAAAVVSEAVSAALVRSHPQAAAAWEALHGEGAIAAADDTVSQALTGSEIERGIAQARQAVRGSPASASALRVLGQAYQLQGDDARAHTLIAMAGQRSFRDTPSQLWLFREDLSAGRFNEAFTRADLLLWRNPQLEDYLFPAMVAYLDRPPARTAMLSRLRLGPNWRAGFIARQAQSGEQGGVAPWLLTNLTSSPNPPTEGEIAAVAKGFVVKGDWAAARAWWSRFRRPNDPMLFDGDFEQPVREPPFGWRLQDLDGAVASVEPLDGRHALFAQFPVGRRADLADLLVLLEPGRYRLSGRFKVDQLPSGAVFRWTLSCAESESPLMTWETGQTSGWRPMDSRFEVPAEGCAAQWLRLVGDRGEGYLPASSWFDDLKLERTP
jgi:hypothetical protein